MRPAFINALFITASFLAPACAVFEPRWEPVAPPMEPVPVQVSVEQLRAICENEAATFRSFACVRRRFETLTCLVFASVPRVELPAFVIHHEEQKHCREGLNHD